MALRDEIRQENTKLKDMPFKKKVEYIWEYYKFHIIGVIAAVVFIAIFIRDWRENRKPMSVDAILINSDVAYEGSDLIKNDYIKYAGVDTTTFNTAIDTSIIISEGSTDQMTMANTQKIMALYAAGSLDAVIGPDSVMDGYGAIGACMDLNDVLSPSMISELEDKGCEMYYTTVYETDDNGKEQPVATYLAGVYLDNSPYLNNMVPGGAYATQKEEGHRPVFTLASCATRIDGALKLLWMLTEK